MSTIRSSQATPPSPGPSGLSGIEQVYVTHCSPGDSFAENRRAYGFGVRASSTKDPDLLKFAFESSSYELPADLRYRKVDPSNTPRRLALLKGPGGLDALVHTSHVTHDTSNPPRLGSYFSHILFATRLTLRQALESWASPGWMLDYPQGAPKALPTLAALPSRGLVNEAALSVFLANGPAPPETSLDVMVWPSRLNKPEARRKLVRRVLQWASLYRNNAQGTPRLTLSAEPGLAALLLFAVARLLPPSYSEGLTFSTFETETALKDDRLATLVINATYGRPAQAGPITGAPGRRMLVLDTNAPDDREVPEVDSALAAFDTLIARTGRGDWDGVARIHEFLGKSVRPLSEALVEVNAVGPNLEAIEVGTATEGDLLAVMRCEVGRSYLKSSSLQPKLWSQVFRYRGNRELAKLYTDLFRESAHLADFRATPPPGSGDPRRTRLERRVVRVLAPPHRPHRAGRADSHADPRVRRNRGEGRIRRG